MYIPADSFDYPVNNNDLPRGLHWEVPCNPFGNYLSTTGGFHPGDDWIVIGGSLNDTLGKPARAIGNGIIRKISNLGILGYMLAIEHYSPIEKYFYIKGKSGIKNGQNYSYQTGYVSKIYSIYIHINNIQVNTDEPVLKGHILGFILDPGNGPHLHFEIRNPNTHNSKNWSLFGDQSNWAYSEKSPNGYYLCIQKMVDDGSRDPSEFIITNFKI